MNTLKLEIHKWKTKTIYQTILNYQYHLQINFLVAVGTSLFLADNAPAADAELVKLMSAGQLEGVLDDSLLPSLD